VQFILVWTHRTERKYRNGLRKRFKKRIVPKARLYHYYQHGLIRDWFHNHIYNKCGVEIEFIKGRLKFGDAKNSAPFPSMVVVIKPCPDPSIQYCRRGNIAAVE
jgi:hypothetical protein